MAKLLNSRSASILFGLQHFRWPQLEPWRRAAINRTPDRHVDIISDPPNPQLQAHRRTLLQRANVTDRRTDKQTDGRTPNSHINSEPLTMQAASTTLNLLHFIFCNSLYFMFLHFILHCGQLWVPGIRPCCPAPILSE